MNQNPNAGQHVLFAVALAARSIPYLQFPRPDCAPVRVWDPRFQFAVNESKYERPPSARA